MIGEVPSSAIALLLLDMKSKELCLGTLPIATWESRISEHSTRTDWTWLLAYEGFRHGWLADRDNLMKRQLFAPMDRRDVVFFDPTKNLHSSKSHVADRRKVRKQERLEVRLLMQAMRGVDWGEY